MSGISAIGGAMPQVVSGASKQVVSGASKSMSKGHMMSQLFQQIDASNSGSISEAQFNSAFQSMNLPPGLKAMGANAVYNQLDPNDSGSISKQDFISGMRKVMAQAHHGGGRTNAVNVAAPSVTSASATQSFGNILDALV